MKKQYKVNNSLLEVADGILIFKVGKIKIPFVTMANEIGDIDGGEKVLLKIFPTESRNINHFIKLTKKIKSEIVEGLLFFTNYERNTDFLSRIYETMNLNGRKKVANVLVHFLGEVKKSSIKFVEEVLILNVEIHIKRTELITEELNRFVKEKLK